MHMVSRTGSTVDAQHAQSVCTKLGFRTSLWSTWLMRRLLDNLIVIHVDLK